MRFHQEKVCADEIPSGQWASGSIRRRSVGMRYHQKVSGDQVPSGEGQWSSGSIRRRSVGMRYHQKVSGDEVPSGEGQWG